MATKRPDSIEEFQRKRREKQQAQALPPTTHNRPSDLPALNEQRRVYVEQARNGMAILRKTFETWVGVGRGLKALHDMADEIGGKRTYDRLRESEGLGKDVINKTRSSRLIAIIDNLAEVEKWRAQLTDKQRFEWASPEAVHRHCPVFAKDRPAKQPKPNVGKPADLWKRDPKEIAAEILNNLTRDRLAAVLKAVAAQVREPKKPKRRRKREVIGKLPEGGPITIEWPDK